MLMITPHSSVASMLAELALLEAHRDQRIVRAAGGKSEAESMLEELAKQNALFDQNIELIRNMRAISDGRSYPQPSHHKSQQLHPQAKIPRSKNFKRR